MSRLVELALALLMLAAATAQAEEARFPGIGRAATAAEVTAWDIDVRPDFVGLPKGSGRGAAEPARPGCRFRGPLITIASEAAPHA